MDNQKNNGISEDQALKINQALKAEIGEIYTSAIQWRTLYQDAAIKNAELIKELEELKKKMESQADQLKNDKKAG